LAKNNKQQQRGYLVGDCFRAATKPSSAAREPEQKITHSKMSSTHWE